MINGSNFLPNLGLDIKNNWSNKYGFVDISAVSLENELQHGYDFMSKNIEIRKQFILDTLNNGIQTSLTQVESDYSLVDENIVENDAKIIEYKKYLTAIIQLSAKYQPLKYEYDSLFKDQEQASYLAGFQQDMEITLVSLNRLSSYSIDKDAENKIKIIQLIEQIEKQQQDIILYHIHF